MEVYDRTKTKEHAVNLCPECGWQGVPKSAGPNKSLELYEEVYVCFNCSTKWQSIFTFVEKIVISKRGEE